jgi:hypothetical protein
MKLYRYFVAGGMLLILAGIMLGSVLAQDTPADPTGPPPVFLREYYDAWVKSAHADVKGEPFNHWNTTEDKKVPADCARCHSTPGYRDYVGADQSEANKVDKPADIGTVINCDACHNQQASHLTAVTFPSGAEITNLNESARCMVCHQGRASTQTVNASIEKAGLKDTPDKVSDQLKFINIHYYAAAASLYGSEVHGGYEIEGKSYQRRFEHVEGFNTCINCHNPHTLEVQVDKCGSCHKGVKDIAGVEKIRMNGSLIDYDGDGNVKEGIKGELQTLQEKLMTAMQTYAKDVAGKAIAYDAATYPYFFIDTNGNGKVDKDEATAQNGYNAFTARLLQAAYNYQVTTKDPGAFAHNAKYHIELMYDSIESLNSAVKQPVDLSTAHRDDPGHFNSTVEQFRHWDAEGVVPATCSKCHTAGGLPFYLKNGVNIASPPSGALACSTCHDNIGKFTLYQTKEVTFPSGAKVSFGENEPANLCLNCHQGRESTVSVNALIKKANVGADETSDGLNFRNVHYFAAGATLFGGEAMGAYQFDGKEYSGRNLHVEKFDTCIECHNEHALTIEVKGCTECHKSVRTQEDVFSIRKEAKDAKAVDYNGNGDTDEPIKAEIKTLYDDLLAHIQSYAKDKLGVAIAYSPSAYPYFFIDTNGNGSVDPDEAISDNAFKPWTPNLLRAAYNYQYVTKDPGAFAHNPDYVLQILYDSIEAMGGADAVAKYTRPPMR